MTRIWFDVFRLLDVNVNAFVFETADENPDNYQVKLEAWRSVASRSLVGEFRHLPTNRKVAFRIRLPV